MLIKPDGLRRHLAGEVVSRLSATGCKMVASKVVQVTEVLARKHYAPLASEPFFGDIVGYLAGRFHGDPLHRVIASVYWGHNGVERIKDVCGPKNPERADRNSIRGSLGRISPRGIYENVVHCSGDDEEAEREIKLWFAPEDLCIETYPIRWKNLSPSKVSAWATSESSYADSPGTEVHPLEPYQGGEYFW